MFCVYQIQDVALNNIPDPSHSQAAPVPRPILSALDIHTLAIQGEDHDVHDHDVPEAVVHDQDADEVENKDAQVWITLGLCWSANAQVHGKENFPYKDSAPLSSQLWMKMTPAKVVIQIVYSEPEPTEELMAYKAEMEGYGVLVKLVPTGTEMKCVLKSQLIRILAYLLPEVTTMFKYEIL